MSPAEFEPIPRTDESLKITDPARSDTARFIGDSLTPKQQAIQARLNKDFFYPAQNIPPQNRRENGTTLLFHPEGAKPHDRWLTSGVVLGTIPCAQEETTLGGVIDLAKFRLGDPRRIMVVIAPPREGHSQDQSPIIAEASGALTVYQQKVLNCLDPEKANKLLGIPYPFPPGKGATLLAGALFRFLIQPDHFPSPWDVQYLATMDSDLKEPERFDVWGYLADAAYSYGLKLQYRAARGGRGNEPVNAGYDLMIDMFNNDPLVGSYLTELARDQWHLTGQHMDHPLAEWHRMHPTGHDVETGTNWSLVDLMKDDRRNPQGLVRAQVAIPQSCLDAGNSPRKEQGMMLLINHFSYTLAKYIQETGKPIKDWGPADFKEINKRLQKKREFRIIPVEPGPKNLIPARPDYIWPPLLQLVENGIIISDRVATLRNTYAQKHPGVEIGQTSALALPVPA